MYNKTLRFFKFSYFYALIKKEMKKTNQQYDEDVYKRQDCCTVPQPHVFIHLALG